MQQGTWGTLRKHLSILFALAALPAIARGQVVVKVNDEVNFRFGAQLQTWADEGVI